MSGIALNDCGTTASTTDLLDTVVNCCTALPMSSTNPFDGSSDDEADVEAAAQEASPHPGTTAAAEVSVSSPNPFDDDDQPVDKNLPLDSSLLEEDEEEEEDSTGKAGDDEEEDGEDLDAALADLDIDGDFQLFSSFRKSIDHHADDDDDLMDRQTSAEDSCERMGDWSERVARTEIYSHRYRPGAEELQELRDLQDLLGIKPDGSKHGFFGSFGYTAEGVEEENQQAWLELFSALDDNKTANNKPGSVILKRGPVFIADRTMEIIVLTHGMLVLQVEEKKNVLGRNILQRTLDRVILWKLVASVGPLASDPVHSWQMVFRDEYEDPIDFQCATSRQMTAWLGAMEMVLIQHHLHGRTATQDLGWQYTIARRPAFTFAVTGKDEGFPLPKDLNELDQYNEYTALHYAVRLSNLDAVCRLLDAKANVDIKDGEGHTAMYYALRDEVSSDITDLLEKYGASKKKKNKEWKLTEELFGKVMATEAKVAKKKEKDEQQKAVAAQAQMSENMRLLNERGQKIEQLDDKARNLNQNAKNYGDMAKLLKEKTKRGAKGSKWLPF